MKKRRRLDTRWIHPIYFSSLLHKLEENPDIWNQNPERLATEVHSQVSDIWLRYNRKEVLINDGPETFTGPHFAIWYPVISILPQAWHLAMLLMAQVHGTHLGGVLITKIPPGGKVLPHIDKGWHPEFYNLKLYVVLKSNNMCLNRVEDEAVVMQDREIWYFDNTKEHEVINNGPTERITLIVCIRTEEIPNIAQSHFEHIFTGD